MPASQPQIGKQKDPAQQKLREHKRQWNAAYRDLSQKLKAFKDGLNGKGNTKFSVPPSDIKDPFPSPIGAILDGIASEFQHLIGDAKAIIQEQQQYSLSRRKKKPKSVEPKNVPPIQAPPEDKIVETISQLASKYIQIEKNAGKISRFWQYLKAPFSQDHLNRYRVGLLSSSADLYYGLFQLEDDILSLKTSSIPKSVIKFQSMRYSFKGITDSFARISELLANVGGKKQEQQLQKKPVEPNLTGQQSFDLQKIQTDLHAIYNTGIARPQVEALHIMIDDYESEEDPGTKSLMQDRVKESYLNLVKSMINEVQKKYGPVNSTSVSDIINLIRKNQPKQASMIDAEFIKEANKLTRFLKKQLVKARSYNKTAAHRLKMADLIEDTADILKHMMKSLEKSVDQESLNSYVSKIEENFGFMTKIMSTLFSYYEEDYYKIKKEKDIHKEFIKNKHIKNKDEYDDPFFNSILNRKVKKDILKGF